MALSEREQKVLRDLEEQLNAEDPSLVSSMAEAEKQISRPSPRHVGAGVALVLVGLSVVLGGVVVGHAVWSVVLGVAGFALAVWGVTLMLTRESTPRKDSGRASSGSRGPRGGGKGRARGRSSFMDRQAERWERRGHEDR